jgi:hypothetical protein
MITKPPCRYGTTSPTIESPAVEDLPHGFTAIMGSEVGDFGVVNIIVHSNVGTYIPTAVSCLDPNPSSRCPE